MIEHEDHLAWINTGEENFEATVKNTSIFRHLGKYALYDHLFIELPHNQGIYIWNDNQHYESFGAAAVEAGCTIHINLREVARIDKEMYEQHSISQFSVPDTLPDDFDV